MNMKQSCKALICAIEGELDGRHCTEEQAAAILDHALPSLTEALARVEAERDEAREFMRINAKSGMQYAEQRDALKAQLVIAAGLLRDAADPKRPCIRYAAIKDFLARHHQAVQQAGDERAAFIRAFTARMGYAPSWVEEENEFKFLTEQMSWESWQARAALATQPAAAPVAADGPETNAKQLAASLKFVQRWDRPGQATEWEFEVPGSFNRHVVASSEQVARAKIAQDVRREAPPAAAHGDELVAVVGTVPDGSGFKSLDFKVDLDSLPDGTRLYAQSTGGAST